VPQIGRVLVGPGSASRPVGSYTTLGRLRGRRERTEPATFKPGSYRLIATIDGRKATKVFRVGAAMAR
jgi:hypothetical protein